jgi:EAL domain-containing protein (putative c-di-GMP-specific phosphodiesterase class I)
MHLDNRGRVVVVDDDELLCRAIGRALSAAGHEVHRAYSVDEALSLLRDLEPDVIVSDIQMPGRGGLDLLSALSRSKPDVPVVLLTGALSSSEAVSSGSFRYLVKPVSVAVLQATVGEALHARSVARGKSIPPRAELERAFGAALSSLWISTQPIVSAQTNALVAYELSLRSDEPTLPDRARMLEAAIDLGEVDTLSRAMHIELARCVAEAPIGPLYFLDIRTPELLDPRWFDRPKLSARRAERVVIEISDGATSAELTSVKVELLHVHGCRIAIRDVAAGTVSLARFTKLRPAFLKVGALFTRGVDTDEAKQRRLGGLVTVARRSGVEVLADDIETGCEREAVAPLGCHLVQGAHIGTPTRGFTPPTAGD